MQDFLQELVILFFTITQKLHTTNKLVQTYFVAFLEQTLNVEIRSCSTVNAVNREMQW